MEAKLKEERERERVEKDIETEKEVGGNGKKRLFGGWPLVGSRHSQPQTLQKAEPHPVEDAHQRRHKQQRSSLPNTSPQIYPASPFVRQSAKSISFSQAPKIPPPVPLPFTVPGLKQPSKSSSVIVQSLTSVQQGAYHSGRPRAKTSPWLPSLFFGDHQSWFNDPRFDGSFPSRVLPFLYLGNLNHASNVYMLHALGITHVVSVGECALVPPPYHMSAHGGGNSNDSQRVSHACYTSSSFPFNKASANVGGAHYIPGNGVGQGSLWLEEREGRIKVLDIKGVCDDGIDTLEPQLEPICDWIDQAREEGGQVLVHCRVGVSRSATVTIAYVMKHLGLPLVDAYLIVRSRRLSVLIQPNMRLLYNLCGWEIKLAKQRACEDDEHLKSELSKTLTWPFLAKEVHALNEKYLH